MEENANASFLRGTKRHVHWFILYSTLLTVKNLIRLTSQTLLVTLEWI